jgi:type III pantothenate kinase
VILCLDAGNSCLKWGITDASGWQARGQLVWAQLSSLRRALALWHPTRGYLASVVGATREGALTRMVGNIPLTRLTSGSAALEVTNGYGEPETLGIDRWCALIGARHLEKRPCLVVMLGTATTVDALDGEGNFLGGMILPGFAMMRDALAKGTANLPMVEATQETLPDEMPRFPTDTESAIINGCLEAKAGVIERAFKRLPDAACCFVSGGSASHLVPRLTHLPVEAVPQLALEGVRLLALADQAKQDAEPEPEPEPSDEP